jgi:hypothetical protein
MSFINRIKAAVIVIVLIGSITLGCMELLIVMEPAVASPRQTDHVNGLVKQVDQNTQGLNFEVQTSTGRVMKFTCEKGCRATLGHLQRHIREKAKTDVYYIEGPNNSLIALDVD